MFVVAISTGVGMIPLVAPTLFRATPPMLHTLLDSGVLIASIASVGLNAFFNAGHLQVEHDQPIVADHV